MSTERDVIRQAAGAIARWEAWKAPYNAWYPHATAEHIIDAHVASLGLSGTDADSEWARLAHLAIDAANETRGHRLSSTTRVSKRGGRGKNMTDTERMRMVRAVLKGQSATKVANAFGVDVTWVYRLVREYKAKQERAA